jgi:IS4 transposase
LPESLKNSLATKPMTEWQARWWSSEKAWRWADRATSPQNRTKPKTQDGRKLRRYKRRWKVERLFAWLQNFRRLVVRYERHADNFLAFLLLACSIILLRFFWDRFMWSSLSNRVNTRQNSFSLWVLDQFY